MNLFSSISNALSTTDNVPLFWISFTVVFILLSFIFIGLDIYDLYIIRSHYVVHNYIIYKLHARNEALYGGLLIRIIVLILFLIAFAVIQLFYVGIGLNFIGFPDIFRGFHTRAHDLFFLIFLYMIFNFLFFACIFGWRRLVHLTNHRHHEGLHFINNLITVIGIVITFISISLNGSISAINALIIFMAAPLILRVDLCNLLSTQQFIYDDVVDERDD